MEGHLRQTLPPGQPYSRPWHLRNGHHHPGVVPGGSLLAGQELSHHLHQAEDCGGGQPTASGNVEA